MKCPVSGTACACSSIYDCDQMHEDNDEAVEVRPCPAPSRSPLRTPAMHDLDSAKGILLGAALGSVVWVYLLYLWFR
jgi:hypothetical protein